MSKRSADAKIWLPIATAVIRLRKQYEQAGVYSNEEVCFRAATDTILRRLRMGQLPGRATAYNWYNGSPDWDDDPPISADAEGFFAIPAAFWAAFNACHELAQEADWIAGDFEYKDESEFIAHEGQVIGLEVPEARLPVFDFEQGTTATHPAAQADGKGGRSAAKWWPEFAEELAVYIHEEGLPAGDGREGQSTVIDAVFERLVAGGKTEPGRATVQPVVNAVIDRIRSAGK